MASWFEILIRRRWLVVTLAIVGVIGSLVNLQHLSVDAVPDISPKQVMILTVSSGLGPLEVERLVTFPVEAAMTGMPGLSGIRSISRYGVSAVYVTFDDAVEIDAARAQVYQRLALAKATMPQGVGDPQMGPMATGLGEIYQFELRGPGYSAMALRRILQWTISPKLKLVPGIADINIYGGEMPTYEVQISNDALRRFNLSIPQIYAALTANNSARGGAYLEHNDQQQVIRGLGLVKNIAEIEMIPVTTGPNGTAITIGAMGRVVEAPKVRLGAVTHDGEGETVVGIALMQFGDNASAVVERVKEAVVDIQKQLPPGIELRPYYDRSGLVGQTLHTVAHNLAEGAILVVFVLLLMLGNLRAGLIVAAAIPLSMLGAVAGMRLFGLSGNLMSLGAIDFGLIIDGSVVMIENILRHREAQPSHSIEDVTRDAATEVARPIFFAVAIIMIVYLPVLALEGVAGKMFRPMALTVILALFSSLVLTMTVMPALAAAFVPRSSGHERETWIIRVIRSRYEKILVFAEDRVKWVIVVTLVAFGGSCLLATQLGGEFLPKLSEDSIVVTSEKLPGINLPATLKIVKRIEEILKGFPEVRKVVSLTGSAEIPIDPMGVESTDSFVSLRPQSEWKTATNQEGLVAVLQEKLSSELPGVAFSFSQPIQMRMEDLLEGVRGDVAINLYGDDLTTLKTTADQIAKVVTGIKGSADVKPEAQAGAPALSIAINRGEAARFGVNVDDVLASIESIGGHQVGSVYGDDNSITDIIVRLAPEERRDISALANIPVGISGRKLVALSQVADLRTDTVPAQISREKLQRRISVVANVRGRDVQSFVEEAKSAVESQVQMPPRYSTTWTGQFQNLQKALSQLIIVVPVAIAAIFILLVVMFADFRPALVVFLNVPISATGGIVALYMRGLPFSISAAIGFIATFGIAILNGVVLVSYIQGLSEGESPREAAMEAARKRLRPVLMTASVATLGFLPMAISTSAGAEVQRPLATVVIGGLITATMLTLLVIPAIYPLIVKVRQKIH